MPERFENKVVLVTGGGSGIGAAAQRDAVDLALLPGCVPGSIGGDSIRRPARRPDHSKRPDCSGNTTRVDTMTWPFLQQCSKSNLASPMSITVTTPITR